MFGCFGCEFLHIVKPGHQFVDQVVHLAHAGLGMLLLLNKLPFFGHPVLSSKSINGITRDRYALAIEAESEGFNAAALQDSYKKVALWSTGDARSQYIAAMQASNATTTRLVSPVRNPFMPRSIFGPCRARIVV